jgi:acyl-CoA thioester hydrolase
VTSRPTSDSASTASFEQTIRVEPTDLDEQEHVNNLVYVRWVLDAATAHWASLTTPEIRAEVGWVLLRHELDYHSPALLGDVVVVRTEVGHLKGLTFERTTTVRNAGTARALVTSRTLWCPVDPRTGRPRRVSAELRALFSVGEAERGE